MEYLLYAGALTCHSKFKAKKTNVCCWLNPSLLGPVNATTPPTPLPHQGMRKMRRPRARPGQPLPSSLVARAGKCLESWGLRVTALPLPEHQPLDRHPEAWGTAGHVGFKSYPGPDYPGQPYSCLSSTSNEHCSRGNQNPQGHPLSWSVHSPPSLDSVSSSVKWDQPGQAQAPGWSNSQRGALGGRGRVEMYSASLGTVPGTREAPNKCLFERGLAFNK